MNTLNRGLNGSDIWKRALRGKLKILLLEECRCDGMSACQDVRERPGECARNPGNVVQFLSSHGKVEVWTPYVQEGQVCRENGASAGELNRGREQGRGWSDVWNLSWVARIEGTRAHGEKF